MKKYLLAIGLVLALVLAAPVATRAESLNVAQLRAIIASLQTQLNFLIAKLQLQIQQQNQNTPTPTPTSKPSITIASPNGGEIFNVGDTIKIKWSAIVPNNSSISLSVINSNGLMPAGGFISILVPNTGSFDWTIPKSVLWAAFVSGNYKLQARIIGSDGGGDLANDLSDNYFTITSSTPSLKATLSVTALNGAIQCFRAPCEFPLNGAQVTVYDANKALVGNQIVGSSGVATFSNLNPGTYTVYVGASGYTQTSGQTVGLVSGQSASVKIPVFLTR